jgi:fructan beta-fructosidase
MLNYKSSRPIYHFTPPSNWMNDPNGLVYYQGEYHLFYQYHPESPIWGPMHWGHAVGCDLVNWQHLPIALYPDENGMIFSGSVVMDWKNTAGFGEAVMVAIFTHHKEGRQNQSLAYSHDSGRTWTKYSGNPVLSAPDHLHDFRDPKVIWFGSQAEGHWVMCLAAGDRIMFFTSPDLIHWTPSGQLGPGLIATAGVWETPDLFELRVDGSLETRWVLTIGVQGGCPAGGSGTQYFVGRFDGCTFTSENPPETILWADYGADYYAPQSWNNEPSQRRIMLGWMSNWQYANVTPLTTWRGMFSLPRELTLTRTAAGVRLVQQPIPELRKLRSDHKHWQNETIVPGANLLAGLQGDSFEIAADFQISPDTESLGFRVRMGEGEHTSITYIPREQKVYLDRTHSGQSDFHPGFARIHAADLAPVNGNLRLHIFVDHSSVEIFANHGQVTLSDSIFPSEESLGLELFSKSGTTHLNALDFYNLHKPPS